MKLYTVPGLTQNSGGGVFSVMTAHERELRKLGVEYVEKEDKADLVIVHALARTARRPDVFHSHGFYPTAQAGWNPGFSNANEILFQSMMTARAVVSVSELAAEVMRRDFHISPHVIRNGVNFHEIRQGGQYNGPILWPKMDINPTCDPAPLRWLAEKRKDLRYASLTQVVDGVHSYGKLPRPEFLKLLRACSIYLGTTRENNSMGTMEAMATGLPVAGYNWGFNLEWLQHRNGCWLVEPGDLEGLEEGIEYIRNDWQSFSGQAREFAKSNFGWTQPIQQIYELYQSLLKPDEPLGVSVVIPLHNYSNWVGAAIQSALDQSRKPLEVIVVDDASTDNPTVPAGVKLIRLEKNVGVAEVRNIGVAKAKGKIILCLDADDILATDYIQRGIAKFIDPRVGIVYGPLALVDENLKQIGKRWFDAPFNTREQFAGANKVPTCAMFRKEAWRRAGGYRKYESPAEDAGLWTRIASQGWQVKFLNDNRPTLYYRMHEGSLSRSHKFPDWVNHRAWKKRNSGVGNPVQIYDCPQVSFSISYHEKDLLDFIHTVDSLEGLIGFDWEICAQGEPTPRILAGWPFIRWNVEPSAASQVHLEAGEILTDSDWNIIMERREWPK
jgi:glycosyltransferase involved in cell wall biosynthesis